MTKRRRVISAVTLAAALVAGLASIGMTSAHAATIAVPAVCSNAISSITVVVGDIVDMPLQGAGCTLVSNSATGNLDRVSATGFVAFAEGTGAVFSLVESSGTQFLNKVNVTIGPAPTPSPSASVTTTASATATATASPSRTPSATASAATSAATASTSPSNVPVTIAEPTAPTKKQQLSAASIKFAGGIDSGTVTVFDAKGNPLQLLSLSGDTAGVRVASRGMNYTWQPSNWQRLGYGDLCWSYAGYSDVQALILPVTTPPFRTVSANWTFSSAIVSTSAGNTVFEAPQPGEVVSAGGRAITAVTLCAHGTPTTTTRTSAKAPSDNHGNGHGNEHGNGNVGGHEGTGQCRGEGNFKHGCELHSENTHWPYVPQTGTTSGPSAQPSVAPTQQQPEEKITFCQATTSTSTPYRKVTLPISQIEYANEGSVALFPTPGWTSIIPPVGFHAGQNWPVGQSTLADNCRVPKITVTGVVGPTISGSSPGPSTSTAPPIVGTSPAIVVQPVPQPSFTAFGPINPWPPQYPIPVPAMVVPTAQVTPTPTTTYAVPTPTGPTYAVPPSPIATPPSPYATPSLPTATPSFPVPPSPPPLPTPTAKPSPSYAVPPKLPETGPYLVPPLQAPSVPLTPVLMVAKPIATPTPVPQPSTQSASPLASPPISGSGVATATPIATPPTTNTTASPLASPPIAASPSATTSASTTTSAPSATGGPSTPPPSTTPGGGTGTGVVTMVLTNGPDTVTVQVPVPLLVSKGQPGTSKKPTELANTGDEGSSNAWPLAAGLLVLAVVALPWARPAWRRRLPVIGVLAAASVALGTQAAWSAASETREFREAQGNPVGSIARLTFHADSDAINGASFAVFPGTDAANLRKGPGWYAETSRPGRPGNLAIAGHRTGFGAPFADVDRLVPGDTIDVRTPAGALLTYRVVGRELVSPEDTWVLGDDPLGTSTSTLTLTTCDPPHVNTGRLVVFAELVNGSSSA